MNRTKVNYWVDLVIALAFVGSAVSGIVFLFPYSGSTAVGIPYIVWDQIHTWSSLLMIGGVFAHLVLHWKWIVAMTRKTFFPARPARPVAAGGTSVSRRHFLRTAGLGALAFGAAALSYKTLFGSDTAVESQSTTGDSAALPAATVPAQAATSEPLPTPEMQVTTNEAAAQPSDAPTATAPTATVEPTAVPAATSIPLTVVPTESAPTQMTVACRKGVTYDPYPGKCRQYVDADGDGYCDYSIPTAL